jgi:hypothetical protein
MKTGSGDKQRVENDGGGSIVLHLAQVHDALAQRRGRDHEMGCEASGRDTVGELDYHFAPFSAVALAASAAATAADSRARAS